MLTRSIKIIRKSIFRMATFWPAKTSVHLKSRPLSSIAFIESVAKLVDRKKFKRTKITSCAFLIRYIAVFS